MELERRSSGVAKAGLTTGIIGTSLGALGLLGAGANGLGNLFGRVNAGVQPVVVMDSGCGYGYGRSGEGCCSEDHFVNRYELSLQQKIAEQASQIALRDADTYTDQKNLEMYKYVDGRLKDIERELSAQAVVNQKTADSFVLAQKDLQCCCDKLQLQIDRERDERKCADNTIITYTNATFYPKMVADVTVGTTTTAQSVYDPLPCSNSCNCGNR